MSVSSLSQKDKTFVWVRAGGRCQYPGCPERLWRDDLTLAAMNRAYLAHIYGDRPGGPRYEEGTSERLAKDPSNFMLLCDTHHRLVDVVDVEGHTAEKLLGFKRDHEERIERVTGILTPYRTHILLFGSRIGDHSGLVCFDQAREAVVAAGRYPATDHGIRIDLADAPLTDADDAYWPLVRTYIDRALDRSFADGVGPTGHDLDHLSVFALAPQPALIYFGKALGDIVAADVYQRHRAAKDWAWREAPPDGFDVVLREPDVRTGEHVAVSLSFSAHVLDEAVAAAVGDDVPVYELSVPEPTNRIVRSPGQIETFSVRWRSLLNQIKRDHGPAVKISLFPAAPVSIAVQVGREILPKADPSIDVYDFRRDDGGFRYALTV